MHVYASGLFLLLGLLSKTTMNKTLLILIAGIVIIGGLIGYTVLGKSSSTAHTDGDGHTTAQHEATPHDDTGTTPHDDTTTVPHDDTGTAPHND